MITKGNISEQIQLHPENRGWIVGDFISKDSPLFSEHVQIKWVEHTAGDRRNGSHSEVSQKSIDIMLEGRGKFIFPTHGSEYILEKGDYVVYDTSECEHIFEAITDTRHIVIRTPLKEDSQNIIP